MYIALIDKDMFANLLKYGKIILPEFSFSAISAELPIRDALQHILRSGNPIEYPDQYIIIKYDCSESPNILHISFIKELIPTNADGRKLFSSQFRDDLIIQSDNYQDIFDDYLDNEFKKKNIEKGIISFRRLCDLSTLSDYSKDVNLIHHGLSNRKKYRYHFSLPKEERDEPYALMISYDRYAPYSQKWIGYFCDVIESVWYNRHPDMGYSESTIENTGIYNLISSLPQDSTSILIYEAIKDNKVVQKCNEFYYRPGGYLVPYIFFILRDKFRNSESFNQIRDLIRNMKEIFPEALDTASIFVGGFFGYEKFYDDYYSALNLPIFRNQQSIQTSGSTIQANGPTSSSSQHKTESKGSDTTSMTNTTDGGIDTKIRSCGNITEKSSTHTIPHGGDVHKQGFSLPIAGLCDGSDLFNSIYEKVGNCLNKGTERDHILRGIMLYKNNDEALEEILGLFTSPIEKKDIIKEYLKLPRYYGKSIKKIRDTFQNS